MKILVLSPIDDGSLEGESGSNPLPGIFEIGSLLGSSLARGRVRIASDDIW
jgi:hypothetical protein